MKKIKISDNLLSAMEENEELCIELTVPSMLHESPEKIKEIVQNCNENVNYLLEKGQNCKFVTADGNEPFSYDDLLFLEKISDQIKKKIQEENFLNNVEKARLIEYVIFNIFTPISWDDPDFDAFCDLNLLQAMETQIGSCSHYAALTQYLHLRNNIYSDIIYAKTNRTKIDEVKKVKIEYYHMFNLMFIGENSKKWTCIDSMWEYDFFKNHYSNEFSFVSFKQIQNSMFDYSEAHKHPVQKINEVPTININLLTIDMKLGSLKNIYYYLYPTCVFMTQDIFEGHFEKAIKKFNFSKDDKTISNLCDKSVIIQIMGMVSYICSIELENQGLTDSKKRKDENGLIKYVDTYLKFIFPRIYGGLYWERIKNNESIVITEGAVDIEYLQALFEFITDKDGNLKIYFDDSIDKFCLYINFSNQEDLPIVEVIEY